MAEREAPSGAVSGLLWEDAMVGRAGVSRWALRRARECSASQKVGLGTNVKCGSQSEGAH